MIHDPNIATSYSYDVINVDQCTNLCLKCCRPEVVIACYEVLFVLVTPDIEVSNKLCLMYVASQSFLVPLTLASIIDT